MRFIFMLFAILLLKINQRERKGSLIDLIQIFFIIIFSNTITSHFIPFISVIPKIVLFEDSILNMQSNKKRGKGNSQEVNNVVILNEFNLPQEVNSQQNTQKQDNRIKIDSSCKNFQKHNQKYSHMQCDHRLLFQLRKIPQTKVVHKNCPFQKILVDRLSVPPICVEHSVFDLTNLAQTADDIFKHQVIHNNVHIKGVWNYLEEECQKTHLTSSFYQRIDKLYHQNIRNKNTSKCSDSLLKQVKVVQFQFRIVLHSELRIYNDWTNQKFKFKVESFLLKIVLAVKFVRNHFSEEVPTHEHNEYSISEVHRNIITDVVTNSQIQKNIDNYHEFATSFSWIANIQKYQGHKEKVGDTYEVPNQISLSNLNCSKFEEVSAIDQLYKRIDQHEVNTVHKQKRVVSFEYGIVQD